MTPNQVQKTKDKITAIKRTLAAEKKKFGAYDDSRGLRYMPPGLFIKIQDYKGALNYFRWFAKAFPRDGGFPDFLFEWTISLFKNGKLKEAEQKARETFFLNSYLFDVFFDKPVIRQNKEELAGYERPEYAQNLIYSFRQPELSDFSKWLISFIDTERFKAFSMKFMDIKTQLLNVRPGEMRTKLVDDLRSQLFLPGYEK